MCVHCRQRGHKADGNKNMFPLPMYGLEKVLPESKQIDRPIKSVEKENEDLKTDITRISSFYIFHIQWICYIRELCLIVLMVNFIFDITDMVYVFFKYGKLYIQKLTTA